MASLPVSVAYALPDRQWVVEIELASGATVADALAQVADGEPFVDLDLAALTVGVYGEPAARQQPLRPHDRIEIYRPLLVDPKSARRQRAAASAGASSSTSDETSSAADSGK